MKTNKANQRPKTPDKILILKVMAPTSDGDIFARPVFWDEVGDEPMFILNPINSPVTYLTAIVF